MKMIYFKTAEEKVVDGIIEKAFGMITTGKYAEAYERREIVPCRIKDKDDTYIFMISVDDCVPVAFNIIAGNSMDGDGSEYELAVESRLFSEVLRIPKTVETTLNWRPDYQS